MHRQAVRVSVVALILLLVTSSVGAQESGGDDAALRARIAELESLESPGPEQSAELTELKAALEFRKEAAEASARRQKLVEDEQGASNHAEGLRGDLNSIEEELKLPVDLKPEAPSESATTEELRNKLDEIESKLEAAEADRQSARENLSSVEADQATHVARRAAIPGLLSTLRTREEEVRRDLLAFPPETELSRVQQARKTNLQAEANALAAQVAELEQELLTRAARRPNRELRGRLARARVDRSERIATAWRTELDRCRAVLARREKADAVAERDRAENQHPIIRKILVRNAELAGKSVDIAVQRAKFNKERDEISGLVVTWTDNFTRLKRQINRVGLSDVIGSRLRNLRVQLAEPQRRNRDATDVRDENERVQNLSVELESERIMNLDAHAEGLVSRVPEAERASVRAAAVAALTTQQDRNLKLWNACEEYSTETLFPLQGAHIQLADVVEKFLEYINQRLLWIRSTHRLNAKDFGNLDDALAWLVAGENWAAVRSGAWKRISERPVNAAALLLPFVVLLALRRRFLRSLDDAAGKIKRAATDRMGLTVKAAVLTVLLALTWPLLLYAFSRLIHGPGPEFVAAFSAALARAAGVVFFVAFLWHLCRPKGLGEGHFRWNTGNMSLVRRQLRWLVATVPPIQMLVYLTDSASFRQEHDSLGRLAFCISSILIAIFLRTVLHPKRGILKGAMAEREGGWLDRLQPVWFTALYCLPLFSALLASLGYFFTARDISARLTVSIWLIVGSSILRAMLMRWLFVARRRMAIEQYRRRREAERQAAAEESTEDGGEEIPLQEEAALGLEEVSAQTMRLVRSAITVLLLIGLLGIWANTLPALGFLDQYALWIPSGATATVDADGSTALPPEAFTVMDMLLAVVIAFLTIVVSRNVPGVLEMLVLRRLPIDNGARYAIRTLTRYAILIIGMVLTFSAIGIGWGKVQFLAAAVSVGLGFGLQEIFANFVSGLIILTERPVRVGDTVTVGNICGVVSRIQMRATTVTDWDRKELLIPNKEFITGQVTNWCLSNAILRLKLLVGIAYGSDTATAKRLLLEVAAANPLVLDSPAPAALFMEFANSSLTFELRVFIDQIQYMSVVRDQLNFEIDHAFRKASIEIAFPQRDIHIRTGDIVQPGTTAK